MRLDDYLDFLEPDVIRLKGHRIGLEDLVERYNEGYSAEQLMLEFPGLELELIYGAFAYYLHNRAEVDAYVARVNAIYEERRQEADALPDTPAVQRIRAALAAVRKSAA